MRCRRQALALGAEPTADVPAWVLLGLKIDQCPHSAEGDMRALNEGSGFDPTPTFQPNCGCYRMEHRRRVDERKPRGFKLSCPDQRLIR
jgi:hypothetical protein